jgi:hypothetical protein
MRFRSDPWVVIKAHLTAQTPEKLIDMLMEVAQRDEQLYQLLLLKAETTGDGKKMEAAFRRAIDVAVSIDDFVDWREVDAFAGKMDQVLDSLAELLKPETVFTLIELAEYALACCFCWQVARYARATFSMQPRAFVWPPWCSI